MMTPEQRYLLDAAGYLHIKNPLSDEELNRAQEAADRYINTPNLPPRELEPTVHHDRYSRGFAYDKGFGTPDNAPLRLAHHQRADRQQTCPRQRNANS